MESKEFLTRNLYSPLFTLKVGTYDYSEFISHCEQELMTLVADLYGIGIVGDVFIRAITIVKFAVAVHERMELSVLCAVLVRYIETHIANVVAYTTCDAVC